MSAEKQLPFLEIFGKSVTPAKQGLATWRPLALYILSWCVWVEAMEFIVGFFKW